MIKLLLCLKRPPFHLLCESYKKLALSAYLKIKGVVPKLAYGRNAGETLKENVLQIANHEQA